MYIFALALLLVAALAAFLGFNDIGAVNAPLSQALAFTASAAGLAVLGMAMWRGPTVTVR